jgi:Flp pilus assembly protein TadD
VEAYCNIGVIFKNLGKLEDATQYYGKALQINPNFMIARNNMAIALTDYGTKLKNEGKIKVKLQNGGRLSLIRKVFLNIKRL